jgi:hypothetical protein
MPEKAGITMASVVPEALTGNRFCRRILLAKSLSMF